jgi:hypothetical protein
MNKNNLPEYKLNLLNRKLELLFGDGEFDSLNIEHFINYIFNDRECYFLISKIGLSEEFKSELTEAMACKYNKDYENYREHKKICAKEIINELYKYFTNLKFKDRLIKIYTVLDFINTNSLSTIFPRTFSGINSDEDIMLIENVKISICKLIYRHYIIGIYEYIISNLDEQIYLETLLKNYKKRTQNYTYNYINEKIQHQKVEIEKQDRKKLSIEKDILQNDLGLYLIDKGIDFVCEPDAAGGNVDLLCKDNGLERQFVIETKTYKNYKEESCKAQIFSYIEDDSRSEIGYLAIYITDQCNISDMEIKDLDHTHICNNGKEVKIISIECRVNRKPPSTLQIITS